MTAPSLYCGKGDSDLRLHRLYRAKCLTAINADLHAEVTYLNGVSLRFIKNYQIWHHRQHIINLLDSPDGESDFLAQMLDKDAKNYHVWSYRQWLVKHFGLWDDHSEIEEVERFLRRDVRNNSAWNHRWFVVFGKVDEERQRRKKQQQEQQQQQESPSNKAGKQVEVEVTEEVWQREVEFAKDALRMAPQNESPWNYLRGLFRERGRPLSDLTDFAEEFAQVSWEEEGVDGKEVSGEAQPAKQIRSSHALDILADAYAEDGSRLADAERALDMLAERYDPIRANYWHWKKGLLGSGKAAAA